MFSHGFLVFGREPGRGGGILLSDADDFFLKNRFLPPLDGLSRESFEAFGPRFWLNWRRPPEDLLNDVRRFSIYRLIEGRSEPRVTCPVSRRFTVKLKRKRSLRNDKAGNFALKRSKIRAAPAVGKHSI